jgi:hypothetical protein
MEKEPKIEQEQTLEEIFEVINEAMETGKKIVIAQLKEDGSAIENSAIPIAVQGDALEIEADGFGFSIKLDTIKRAAIQE